MLGMRVYAVLACVAVIAVSLAIVARNWSCRKPPEPPQPRFLESGPFEVVEVLNGNTLTHKSGPLGRRTSTLDIEGIVAPFAPYNSASLVEQSRKSLADAAGATVSFITAKNGLAHHYQYASTGASGVCLQEHQLRVGLAWIDPIYQEAYGVPDAWLHAQVEAQKAKRGLWAATKGEQE